MGNLNFTLMLTSREITFLGDKLSISIEESSFFIPVFQRKQDTCNIVNNSEIWEKGKYFQYNL